MLELEGPQVPPSTLPEHDAKPSRGDGKLHLTSNPKSVELSPAGFRTKQPTYPRQCGTAS